MFKNNLGIYIHIPFCNGKCPYCSFYSVTPSLSTVQSYVEAVCDKITYWGRTLNHIVDTVYFGGGTPSIINSSFIAKIMECIKHSFDCNFKEVTIEVNPCNHDFIDLELLKSYGMSLLSSDENTALRTFYP